MHSSYSCTGADFNSTLLRGALRFEEGGEPGLHILHRDLVGQDTCKARQCCRLNVCRNVGRLLKRGGGGGG